MIITLSLRTSRDTTVTSVWPRGKRRGPTLSRLGSSAAGLSISTPDKLNEVYFYLFYFILSYLILSYFIYFVLFKFICFDFIPECVAKGSRL